jgi:hypothetical protein
MEVSLDGFVGTPDGDVEFTDHVDLKLLSARTFPAGTVALTYTRA